MTDELPAVSADYQNYDETKFDEKIKDLTPAEQTAVRKFWRSLVLRSQRAFSEENGRCTVGNTASAIGIGMGGRGGGGGGGVGDVTKAGSVRSCNCCPYGYHIDLDFVRYCESLAHAKPTDEELRRRDRRRSRKSMEFMLGFESLFEQWDADARVQAKLTEAAHESEPDSPRLAPQTHYNAHIGQNNNNNNNNNNIHNNSGSNNVNTLTASMASSTSPPRPRSSSVPRFTYGGMTRAESPFGTASSTASSLRYGSERFTGNSPPETRAFLHEALDEVCNDFERTLERASVKRRKAGNSNSNSAYSISDRNNNSLTNGFGIASLDKRQGSYIWNRYYDVTDSCIAGNKSPSNGTRLFTRSHTLPLQQRPTAAELQYESYVQATVAANAKSPVEQLEPPPPPPRRHQLLSQTPKSLTSPGSVLSSALSSPDSDGGGAAVGANADASTLYNIRQQMALSLKRMKDLEEQVKSIPDMQHELIELRKEKQRLQCTLQRKDDELQRTRDTTSRLTFDSPSPSISPKHASPVQFTPQRISPVSLESLGARLRTNSTSSERQLKSSTLKRDVGTMCMSRTTRDVAVGSSVLGTRAVGTSPMQQLKLSELLYTQVELDKRIHVAVALHEEQAKREQRKKLITVGTQMYVPKLELRESGVQTQPEKPVLKYNVGVTAKPTTRENYVSCKPDVRSVGVSDARIDDVLCEKCKLSKRTIACGTEDIVDGQSQTKAAVPQKMPLETMPARSNTFSLGDQQKLQIKRKTTGTQYSPLVVHTAGSQTSKLLVRSTSTQHSPELHNIGTQHRPATCSKQTDTFGLSRLCISETKALEIAAAVWAQPSSKPQTRNTAINTDPKARTSDAGVNTRPPPPPVRTTHSGSNTEQVHKRDVACGDIVKPHISIACADNYCDSCKDAIKHLAKDFSKVPATSATSKASATALPTARSTSADSRIPRPKHLTSPSPVRKQFKRQNTYTVASTPTPSPSTEPCTMKTSLQEKPPSPSNGQTLESSCETQCFISEATSGSNVGPTKAIVLVKAPERTPGGSYDLTQLGDDELIVREEKRVSISWSRDASPAPLFNVSIDESTPKPIVPELMAASSESSVSTTSASATTDEISKGARKKSSTPLKSSQSEESQITVIEREIKKPDTPPSASESPEKPASKALLQKLAMTETKQREKAKISPELQRALKIINESLLKKMGAKPFSSSSLKSAKLTIQEEWFRLSSTNSANPNDVEDYLDHFEAYSVPLLEYCVNMVDVNGNTAMHYAVSHGNFDVVSILLDSKVCNVNQMNNAGYTCVMLVSLAKLKNAAHRTVVERLFQMADVNIRAKKHCQTALMLAVSHGNSDMVAMLLAASADINIQDEDGSTALMCAAEHGRVDIVKHLLSHQDCDSLIHDMDGSTAFKIAWQAGHRDVGLLLYVHEQMLRSKMPNRGELSPSAPTMLSPRHKQPPTQ